MGDSGLGDGGKRNTGKNTGVVLDLQCRKPQKIMPHQAFMHLFKDDIRDDLKKGFQDYLKGRNEVFPLSAGKPMGWFAFKNKECDRLLAEASDSVKQEVEEYRQHHYEGRPTILLTFDNIMSEGNANARQEVQVLQRSIDSVTYTGMDVLKVFEEQTGLKGTLLLGGPNPESGDLITFSYVISHSVNPALPKQLASLYKGDAEECEPRVSASSMDGDEGDKQAPNSATASSSTTTSTSATLSASTMIASSAGTSVVSTSSTTTDPSLNAPLPTVSSRNTAADTSAPPPEAQELTYDQTQRNTIARNHTLMEQVMLAKSADEAAEIVDNRKEVPTWMVDTKEYLRNVSNAEWWQESVESWEGFEYWVEDCYKFREGVTATVTTLMAWHCCGWAFQQVYWAGIRGSPNREQWLVFTGKWLAQGAAQSGKIIRH
ncbi:uncharacterized protein BXZ73DRAFT_78049 [Epithele typhae]|uniref:uncharacterized protein n=1 Tax=Epithele typhae TaxID=378194 RepID=UPI0020086928|nr:uncharacterized protein BXZ73DRAFT_78049 [Epithele typhae]KAH9929944.1 hypothetical protein BXZ73DRAFT_78049 [Epithele typhae]